MCSLYFICPVDSFLQVVFGHVSCDSELVYVFIYFIMSLYHIFKSNIPTTKMSLCLYYLFFSPLHPNLLILACPFPDSPSNQISFQVKVSNSS